MSAKSHLATAAFAAAAAVFVVKTLPGPEPQPAAKVEAPKTPEQSMRLKIRAEIQNHEHQNGSTHPDGSVYVDLVEAHVSPGASATQQVRLPPGARVVQDSVEYVGTSADKFKTTRFVVDDSGLVTLTAVNTSGVQVPMIAVFRYNR